MGFNDELRAHEACTTSSDDLMRAVLSRSALMQFRPVYERELRDTAHASVSFISVRA